jgi:5-methylcytosine-specific restriction endonuclease McrA
MQRQGEAWSLKLTIMGKKSRRVEQLDPEASRKADVDAAWLLHTASKHLYRRVWLDRHIAVQAGRCAYCNVLMTIDLLPGMDDRKATIDHVIARARGGHDVEENTVAACAACNTAKADMTLYEFQRHPVRVKRLREANTPPDRLAADPKSKFYDSDAMTRGVGVKFRGVEREDVEEYCISEAWVMIPVGRSVDRRGRLMTVKIMGSVEVYFRDLDKD